MHYFKRNIGDYHKKAGRLTMLQHGAYTLLLDSCYDREQFPTEQQAIEWCWASSDEEISAVKLVLSRFFKLEDGIYYQTRIQEELISYQDLSETNKRIALEREAKKRTKREQEVQEREQSEHESPPNHKPITNNHIKGSRLTKDWVFPDEWVFEAKKINNSLTNEKIKYIADGFKDYWIGVAGSKGVKLDWLATWRNWIRNQKIEKQDSEQDAIKRITKDFI